MSTEDFYTEFMQDIYARAGAEENFTETVFVERFCDFLVDQAIINNYSYTGFRKRERGIRVDAWDFNSEIGSLDIFVTDFRFSSVLETITNTDVKKAFKRVEKFFTICLSPTFLDNLEESTPAYDLAHFIRTQLDRIQRIRFFLITNAVLSKRVTSVKSDEFKGIKCTYNVWDIGRIFRIESSGKAREELIVDFRLESPNGIPCLPAFTGSDDIESFLLVLPGELVADLYDEYGERLLEQNVRTFLQFRGNVNKGIRKTIQNEPEMFFAYNNGLTATAEAIESSDDRHSIYKIHNLQIVNGGQTTASIFTSKKQLRANLSNVFVQMKLTVIPPEKVEKVVPRISEYANTQNKVSAADFFSNHPFHLRIEEISRRLWAPPIEGGLQETHWFYERARGQFANAQANFTPAKKREFLLKNPRAQMFTKTDLAKFEQSFHMLPHEVSKGAQKNFAKYASQVGKNWEKDEDRFNDLFFRKLIAKAIVFRYLDRQIMRQAWYGGYKANIVTYTISKLVQVIGQQDKQLDLMRIWQAQQLSSPLERLLISIATKVNQMIQVTPDGITNVTEYCKKDLCWQKVGAMHVPLNEDISADLVSLNLVKELETEAVQIRKIDNGIQAQSYILENGAEYWRNLLQWGRQENLLSELDEGVLITAARIPNRIPSEKQSLRILDVENRMIAEGFHKE
ncbi:MAG: AIPR family protein [Calditrichaeota bacterium]|jgi:hypothetical protein|nr:AIPR family protein [Calditrichota bacterium]